VAAFLYEGDAPLAERRAQALTLDAGLLAELLGRADLRDLLDPAVIAQTEAELQRIAPDRNPRTAEEFADLLRFVGPLTPAEASARGVDQEWIAGLISARRAFEVRVDGRDCVAAVEDAARLRDAYGAALPVGLPDAFLEPVADPIGDVVSRYARTHGPFTTATAAVALGLGPAVVDDALRRLEARGRIAVGGFRPGGQSADWCDVEVLRLIRRRSLAALRREAEPVDAAALTRFLPAWQGVGQPGTGPGGLLRVIEQLEGVPLPASAWETIVLPARLPGYRPSWLDALTTAGDVLWCGRGSLPSGDGWISLHLADSAPLTLPLVDNNPADGHQRMIVEMLDGGAAPFFGQIADTVGADAVNDVADALWDLAWQGMVTNDTLAPVRELLAARGRPGGSPPAAGVATRGRRHLPRPPVRRDLTGRWTATPARDTDPTRRAHAAIEVLLDRHGVLTRGAVAAEGYPGGFAAAYRVLSGFEEAGRCRRIHAITGLGAAQFAITGAVDRLRTIGDAPALLLAAADPANPYGAALPWPTREGHRPGRSAGAVVVLVDGTLTLFMERGGRSLLSFTDDPALLQPAVDTLASTVRSGSLGRVVLQRGDGQELLAGGSLAEALAVAGFVAGPRGLRVRS
jgi:ATP-dependent Lhr-like helicase